MCKKYLLTRPKDINERMSDSSDLSSLDESFEEEQVNRKTAEAQGLGLLSVHSPNFVSNLTLCTQELNTVRAKFTATMDNLVEALALTSQKGQEISFLGEAFTRLNFNNYYPTQHKLY